WWSLREGRDVESPLRDDLRITGISNGREPFRNAVYARVFGPGGTLEIRLGAAERIRRMSRIALPLALPLLSVVAIAVAVWTTPGGAPIGFAGCEMVGAPTYGGDWIGCAIAAPAGAPVWDHASMAFWVGAAERVTIKLDDKPVELAKSERRGGALVKI